MGGATKTEDEMEWANCDLLVGSTNRVMTGEVYEKELSAACCREVGKEMILTQPSQAYAELPDTLHELVVNETDMSYVKDYNSLRKEFYTQK